MLNHSQITALEANWGDKANALEVYALVKIEFTRNAVCYLYAKEPNEDYYLCLVGFPGGLNNVHIGMQELKVLADMTGDTITIDTEYRPQIAGELLKKNRRYINGRISTPGVETEEHDDTKPTS